MKITDFAVLIAWREAGKKQISIAQIKEVLRITKDILRNKTGVNIYQLIKGIEDDTP